VCRVTRRLDLATKIAASAPITKQYRLAAVFYKGGALQSIGQNSEEAAFANGYTLHAERAAIDPWTLKETAGLLYVSRVRSRGDVSLSKPCQACVDWLVTETKVKRVFYTMPNGGHGSIDLNSLRK